MKNLKTIKRTFFFLLLAGFAVSCMKEDYSIGEIVAPTNLTVEVEVAGVSDEMPYGDGSGTVSFNASANNAMTYKFIYGNGFEEVSASGRTTHNFNENGVNDYTVTVIASGTGGVSTNITTTVTVFSDFSDPEVKQLLTGGSSKTWFIAASQPAHLGVGPSAGEGFTSPIWYGAAPFEKAGAPVSSCFYTDEMTFSLQGDNIVYNYNNMGQTFFNASYTSDFGGSGTQDECLDYDGSGQKAVSLSPSTSGIPEGQTRGTVINISAGGFLSYYIGTSSYEILEITPNTMHVRAIMGNDPGLAWYLKLTTAQADEDDEDEEFVSQFNTLLWDSQFDASPTLDTDIWNFETGNNNGWGNQERQYYTEDNVSIEDGNLVITARAESRSGFNYTSSRITTENNFEFQYGRVEARAKLPEGAGTWPAIWMLGSNFREVGWPETGEIDIMEHVGNQQDVIHGTLHYPGRSAGNADGGSITVPNVSSEFNIYTLEWSAERIIFLVNDRVVHTYANNPSSPFNQEFFLILNVAMGGTFGGSIDPAFEESSMEIDYIRVYQ